ncbi:hypothetical protein JB92DRAFT_2833202 [Gautieria morchelliformis]|nr:hypothetical protein JB92DRAFT_2833202 [Gautieria morchelliformis]
MQTRPRHQDGLPYWAVERTQETHLLSVSKVVTTLEAAAAHSHPSIHKILIRVLLYLRCGLRYGRAGLSLISYMADAAMAPVPVLLVLSPEAVRCSTRCDTGVLLAKIDLSAESARFWKRILVTPQVGTGTITGARNDGSSRKGNQHPAPNSAWQQKQQGQRQVAKIRKKKRKKKTVVIRILWGRRRASDTQSRQNKGQENTTDRITGAPARGVEGRRTGKKMGGMAPMEYPPEPAIFHYESVPSHGDPRSSSISGSLKSHDCLNWSGER